MIDRGKLSVLGIHVDAVDYEAAVERIIGAARRASPMAVSALAVHGLMTGVLEDVHRYRLNRFDLLVPDGQPVLWALNLLHRAGLADRVYGPNLMLKLCERAAVEGLPIFLFGSTSETLANLTQNLKASFPTLQIAGTRPSCFRRMSSDERDETVQTIRDSGAKITFVGLGCPRQEIWAYEFRERLGMPIIAVGAAFSFHAGQLPQAPPLLQKHGLEWFFRLLHEPRRLWRRYMYLNPLYCLLVAAQILKLFDFSGLPELSPREELLYG